jgi:hypothetical protein
LTEYDDDLAADISCEWGQVVVHPEDRLMLRAMREGDMVKARMEAAKEKVEKEKVEEEARRPRY